MSGTSTPDYLNTKRISNTLNSFVNEFQSIKKYKTNISIIPLNPKVSENITAIVDFKMCYNQEYLSVGMEIDLDETMESMRLELCFKACLETIDKYISIPFEKIPLYLSTPEHTVAPSIAKKIMRIRLKVGV